MFQEANAQKGAGRQSTHNVDAKGERRGEQSKYNCSLQGKFAILKHARRSLQSAACWFAEIDMDVSSLMHSRCDILKSLRLREITQERSGFGWESRNS